MSMRSLRQDQYVGNPKRPVIGKYLCLCMILYTLVTTAILFWGVLDVYDRLWRLPKVLHHISPWASHVWALLWLQLDYGAVSFTATQILAGTALLLSLFQLAAWILLNSGKRVWQKLIRGCVCFQLTTLTLLCFANIMVSGPNQEMLYSLAAALVIPLNLLLGLRWWQRDL